MQIVVDANDESQMVEQIIHSSWSVQIRGVHLEQRGRMQTGSHAKDERHRVGAQRPSRRGGQPMISTNAQAVPGRRFQRADQGEVVRTILARPRCSGIMQMKELEVERDGNMDDRYILIVRRFLRSAGCA